MGLPDVRWERVESSLWQRLCNLTSLSYVWGSRKLNHLREKRTMKNKWKMKGLHDDNATSAWKKRMRFLRSIAMLAYVYLMSGTNTTNLILWWGNPSGRLISELAINSWFQIDWDQAWIGSSTNCWKSICVAEVSLAYSSGILSVLVHFLLGEFGSEDSGSVWARVSLLNRSYSMYSSSSSESIPSVSGLP